MNFLSAYAGKLAEWWSAMSGRDVAWLAIGMAGQLMFVGRWFIQWLASERAKQLVVPEMFWYASLVGGLMVMAYGLQKPDPVIVLGQFGVFIYARNVYFIWKQQQRSRSDERKTGAAANPPAE